MPPVLGRRVTVVVQATEGELLGTFACEVSEPWLQEVSDVVAVARKAGLDLAILRLHEHRGDPMAEITDCTYVAEALTPPPAGVLGELPPGFELDDHALRLPYARPGGPAADVAWADSRLAALGRRRSGPAEQLRTWNLSCVQQLPIEGSDPAWLKTVPPFFAQEGAVIETITRIERDLGTALALPPLLAFERETGRILLGHCEGPLLWGIDLLRWERTIAAHVERQARLASEVPALLATGMPDWRSAPYLAAARAFAARADVVEVLGPETASGLREVVARLPEKLDELNACGLPETLVHGDLHPGNVIRTASGPVLLDWGDACVGNALLDLPGLCHGFMDVLKPGVRAVAVRVYRDAFPGSDVETASRLVEPICQLRQAMVYQAFLDQIEPRERHYHSADVPRCVGLAIEAMNTGWR